jgi:hypothetical protein
MSKRKLNDNNPKSKKKPKKSSINILVQTQPVQEKRKSLISSEEEVEDFDVSEILVNEKKKLKNSDEEIVNQYIDSFRKEYDLKLNNYFKILNQSFYDFGVVFRKVILPSDFFVFNTLVIFIS